MLTVDYDRLGLRAGHRLLDLGCGLGRHSFEAVRRGADVVACDLALADLGAVHQMLAAMREQGETPTTITAAAVAGDGTALPFPDGTFHRVIAAEVLEHVPDDAAAIAELARVVRPGGVVAVTVPAWLPESVCWRLTDDYHAPAVPGGHVRIYRREELTAKLRAGGLLPIDSHRAHALHTPFWWLRCAVGLQREEHRAVVLYRRVLEWDITNQPRATRLIEKLLDPVLGKSLVVYALRPS